MATRRSSRLQALLILTFVSCSARATPARGPANILDLLEWSVADKDAEVRGAEDGGESPAPAQRNCLCDGPSCICCIDFNLTFVDLGGPGCVRMKYLSQEEGFAVNVSYGNSVLHSQTVKGPDPEPTCINFISRVAQLCARLTELAPTSDGLRGCLQLEPTLLGEPQLDFPLGCFKSGPDGMTMEAFKGNTTVQQQDEEEEEEEEGDSTGINAAQIIQVVNQSAEEGIAFFSSLLGLTFGNDTQQSPAPKPTLEPQPQPQQLESKPEEQVAPAASRSSKSLKGPNMI